MAKTVTIAILWLLIVNIFALLVLNRFNLKADTAYYWINPENFSQNQSGGILFGIWISPAMVTYTME